MSEPRIQKAMRIDHAEMLKEYGDHDLPYLVYLTAFRTAVALRKALDPNEHEKQEASNHDDLNDQIIPKLMNVIYGIIETPPSIVCNNPRQHFGDKK